MSSSKLTIQDLKLRIVFDARMVHYRRAGIGQYAVNLLRAMRRLPEVGPSSVVSVLQMRGDAPIVNDPRFQAHRDVDAAAQSLRAGGVGR